MFCLNFSKRELIKTPIVPPNPILARRIPSFLKTYSQGPSSSNDIPPQWQLCSLYDLQSYEGMMTKLYKDENLSRVKLYETYRALLVSVLAMKTSSNQSKKHSVEKHNYHYNRFVNIPVLIIFPSMFSK